MKNIEIYKTMMLAAAILFVACASDGTLLTVKPRGSDTVRAADQAVLADAIDAAFAQINIEDIQSKISAIEVSPSKAEDDKNAPEKAVKESLAGLNDRLQKMVEKELKGLGNQTAGSLEASLRKLLRKYRKDDSEDLMDYISAEIKKQIANTAGKAGDAVGNKVSKALHDELGDIGEQLIKPDVVEVPDLMTAYLDIVASTPIPAETMAFLKQKAALMAGRLGIRILEVRRVMTQVNSPNINTLVETEYPNTGARVLMLVSYVGIDKVTTVLRQKSHGSLEPDAIMKGRFKGTFAIVPRMAKFRAVEQTIEGESSYKIVKGEYHFE